MSEQTELRALAGEFDRFQPGNAELLRRAADRLDRLTALVANLEEHGDVL